VAQEGSALLETALLVLADQDDSVEVREERAMDRVVIGMDPHKRSVTIEARDAREVLRATGTFGTDTGSYRGMLKVARQWPT